MTKESFKLFKTTIKLIKKKNYTVDICSTVLELSMYSTIFRSAISKKFVANDILNDAVTIVINYLIWLFLVFFCFSYHFETCNHAIMMAKTKFPNYVIDVTIKQPPFLTPVSHQWSNKSYIFTPLLFS